ncbi:hypothetical protein SCHIN_v1c05740 [Spiroplasma chinense]|uniref:Transmembrane protein n=1 Tax=Spiroplasma chinense TaxID=216932 RepID=A0A5B9Y417_9MOLU|nr:hypothetical protein [Spiroplasma chinense]QEH61771.1 hypothetical protein SCHIN_v1c05740 [Spiroplasma chinense]
MNDISRSSKELLVLKLFCYIQLVGSMFLIILLSISSGDTYLTWIIVLLALFFMFGQWFNAAHVLKYSSMDYLLMKKRLINIYMLLTLNFFGLFIFYKGQKSFKINKNKESDEILYTYNSIPVLYWIASFLSIITIVFAFSHIWGIIYNRYSKQETDEVGNSWVYILKLINPLFPVPKFENANNIN